MKKASKKFLIGAQVLFLCSLFLPAIRMNVLDKPAEWEGWRAMFVGLWFFGDLAGNRSFAFVAFAALGNLVFLGALVLFVRPNRAAAHRVFPGAVLCALLFALLAPISHAIQPVQLLSGYFVWLTALTVLLSSAILAGIEQRDNQDQIRLT